MFWMDEKEQEFLLANISDKDHMLEYGSGNSTLLLQNKVEKLVSVEHDLNWYSEIKSKINQNVTYILARPDNPQWERQYDDTGRKNVAGDDGSFEDFATYVTEPLKWGPYDTVFIDGRARVACSYACLRELAPGGKIFIHDFGREGNHPTLGYRTYYDIVYKWLKPIDHVKTMYLFEKK